eukprot:718557-Pelagomonas_calceolata.AAC.5
METMNPFGSQPHRKGPSNAAASIMAATVAGDSGHVLLCKRVYKAALPCLLLVRTVRRKAVLIIVAATASAPLNSCCHKTHAGSAPPSSTAAAGQSHNGSRSEDEDDDDEDESGQDIAAALLERIDHMDAGGTRLSLMLPYVGQVSPGPGHYCSARASMQCQSKLIHQHMLSQSSLIRASTCPSFGAFLSVAACCVTETVLHSGTLLIQQPQRHTLIDSHI